MRQPIDAGFRLSPQQASLWLQHEDSLAFHAQIAVLIEGTLNVQRLKDALQRVITRHEILRTTFRRQSGIKVPFQVIGDTTSFAWNDCDLSSLELSLQAARIERVLREEKQHPFDFLHGPLLRSKLLKLSDSRQILVLTLPALCADAESLKNLVREISFFYGSLLKDRPADEPLQYADYAQWQNDLADEQHDESAASTVFWKSVDVASPPPLKLPFERHVDHGSPYTPETFVVTLDPSVVAQARALENQGASFLLTCWQILLWRLSGQEDVVVMWVSDGRTQQELSGAIGLFVKPLPVRSHLEADWAFTKLLELVQETMSSAYEWQDFFQWDNAHADLPWGFRFDEWLAPRSKSGLRFSIYKQSCHTNRFRMQLACMHRNESWTAELQYDPHVFRYEDVHRTAGYFTRLMQSAAETPRAAISALRLLSENEREQVLVEFNKTTAKYPNTQCVHYMFEEQVERTPNRVALLSAGQQLTYAELNERANQLAHFLRSRGVKPDVVVGLCVERSAEMIVGLLAILKAGGAYLPLIHENPKVRLALQLTETGSPVLLTQERLLGQLPDFAGEMICLDRDRKLWENQRKSNPEHNASPENLVYVIYTSGSTGFPKGVAVRQSSLVNYTNYVCRRLELVAGKEGLSFATLATLAADLGNTAIFPSLVSGGCLHVISYDVAVDGNQLSSYVAEHPIDVLKITPSHLSALMASCDATKILPRKYLVLGGEASTWELLRKIERVSTCTVINHYGPTEATVGSCMFKVGESDVSAWAPVTIPIGRPIGNAQIYILDPHLQPVPVGVPGELFIGGMGLAEGYINQPEQTAEHFVHNPFSSDSKARLYKTGDLARFLPDGNIEFLGRIDDQVKIRGFRVEPAEVESVLDRHPSVRRTVVVPRDEESGNKQLVAYVVPAAGQSTFSVEELRSLAQQTLPGYMVPSAFVILEALPLNTNGKVDRSALPAPDRVRSQSEPVFVMPGNPIERDVAAIWCEVLGVSRVGLHDNFFDLGGHSLLVAQVLARLTSRFQARMSLRSLFETPTVAGLARAIAEAQPQAEVANLLRDLQQLTEEEAEQLLDAERRRAGETESES